MTFPLTSCPLRSDNDFDAMSDEDHHLDDLHSPLVQLSIGMVTSFPLDYMHLVCLGIMKKLLGHWMRGPLPIRLQSHCVQQISENLVSLRKFIPSEFCRKPRELADFDRFKATEFRQILLYTGPIVFRHMISEDMYKHFMLLCVGMTCLLSTHLHKEYCDYARDLFVLFVKNAGALFGDTFLVYNVHSLIHLADDAKLYGPLDTISSFPFENYLQFVKKLVRNKYVPLQNVVNRLLEKRDVQMSRISGARVLSGEIHDGQLPVGFDLSITYTEYKKVNVGGHSFATTIKDSCIMFNDNDSLPGIGKIDNILDIDGDTVFVCRRYKSVENFFQYPLESSKLHIFLVKGLRRTLECVRMVNVLCKCVCLPQTPDSFVIYPLGLGTVT